MNVFQTIILLGFLATNTTSVASAQSPSPCNSGGKFGCFEVGLPGNPKLAAGAAIDAFLDSPKPIVDFINVAVKVVIAVLVIIGVISIVIGGYVYMTAGGDAGRVKMAKEIILAAIVGIFLSLISVVILNTINKYLGSSAQEPQLGGTSPAPAGAGAGDTSGQNSPAGGLTPANTITESSVRQNLTTLESEIRGFEQDTTVQITPLQRNALYEEIYPIQNGVNQLEAQRTTSLSTLQLLRDQISTLQGRIDSLVR